MKAVSKLGGLSDLETYVFIDASNIRSCCLKTLGLKVDFYKLLEYFRKKYPNLKNVYYYEGIAKDDAKKQAEFDSLEKAGYEVRSLERKIYIEPPVYKEVKCRQCKAVRRVQILKKSTKMKSNVDVYLATELLKVVFPTKRPTHIILVSCDGDYAEMIKTAIDYNRNVHISVVATPVVKNSRNTCSTRLQALRRYSPNFYLTDIRDIEKYVRNQK